jgi:pimeloyl-[acyl-carrier protein] synthase
MKRGILKVLAQALLYGLRLADRFITGSNSGIPLEEELRDPYSVYKILRERGSILRSYSNRGWLVLGFDEAQQLFRDPRFSNDTRKNKFLSNALRAASPDGRVQFLDNPTLLQLDAPDHTRLRKLVNHGFSHKYILSMEPRIERIVEECLDSYDATTGQFDVVTQLAKPLPAIVIAELLGLPVEDREHFQDMSNRFLGITVIGDDDLMMEGNKASDELYQYFVSVVSKKRENPTQDLIGQLIAAEEEGDRLTGEELYSICLLMLIAGHETTTRLISNGLHTLLRNRDQFDLLKKDLQLMPNAVEEILRYEPPVQLMPRYVLEDMEFHGVNLKKNQLIVPVIASANRDPSANDNPDVFDISRQDIKHISFGYGPHLCLGLNLARLEAKVAFTRLLERFPDMTLAEQELVWTPVPLVRGMENLIVDTNESAVKKASSG